MNKQNLEEILDLDWETDEKEVIARMLSHLKYWKKWIPKAMESDINFILNLAISEKKKLNALLEKKEEEP